MRHALLIVLLSLVVRAPALDLPPLPPDTTWVWSLSMGQTMNGPLGSVLKKALATEQAKDVLQKMESMAGFDPFRDIDQIVASGADFTPQSSVVISIGRFDGPRLEALVKNTAKGYRTSTHVGITIHRWLEHDSEDKETFAALRNNQLIFAQSLPAIERSLDALISETPVPASGPLASASKLDGALVMAVAADNLANAPHAAGDQSAAMLRKIKQIVASVKNADQNLVFTLDAKVVDEVTAAQLYQMGQGLLMIAANNADVPAEYKEYLAGLRLNHNGDELTLNGIIPAFLIDQFVCHINASQP